MNERVKTILRFWFIESTFKDHFSKNDDYDKKIKENFKDDYIKAIHNELDDWQDNPESCLALVILLDQFSRNLFRNSPLAFKYDYKTRLIVNEAIDRGDLEKIDINRKIFLILPLVHSEDISDHVFAKKLCDTYLKNHIEFKEIQKQFEYHSIAIKKFGRYPHRNSILGRESSLEEEKFLSEPNSSW